MNCCFGSFLCILTEKQLFSQNQKDLPVDLTKFRVRCRTPDIIIIISRRIITYNDNVFVWSAFYSQNAVLRVLTQSVLRKELGERQRWSNKVENWRWRQHIPPKHRCHVATVSGMYSQNNPQNDNHFMRSYSYIYIYVTVVFFRWITHRTHCIKYGCSGRLQPA